MGKEHLKAKIAAMINGLNETIDREGVDNVEFALYAKTPGEEIIIMTDDRIANDIREHIVAFDCEELH